MKKNIYEPYVKKCASIGKELYFYGAEHSNDVSHSQFKHIGQAWLDFLSRTQGKRVAIGEIPVPALPDILSEAITKYGEAGALYWYAEKNNVTSLCPEPDAHEQRRALCDIFSPEHVAYALILQNLASWFHHQRGRSFEEAVMFTIQREVNFADIYAFKPDSVWFDRIHTTLHGDKNIKDKEFLFAVSDPRRTDTEVNEIIAMRTKIRNEYILAKIKKEWDAGNNIFIIYGRGHLASMKQKLETLLSC